MSASNERVSSGKQEDVPTARQVTDVHIPSTSATRSTSANISHAGSDVLSSYVRNARNDVQSTIFTAYSLSRQAATRANEVAVAAYGKDLEGAEQKIAELQAASEAAMKAILRAAAQLDVVVPTQREQDDEKEQLEDEAESGEGGAYDMHDDDASAGNDEPVDASPDMADEFKKKKLIADAKRREDEAIAQAEAELEELGMDAKNGSTRRIEHIISRRITRPLKVSTEVRAPLSAYTLTLVFAQLQTLWEILRS